MILKIYRPHNRPTRHDFDIGKDSPLGKGAPTEGNAAYAKWLNRQIEECNESINTQLNSIFVHHKQNGIAYLLTNNPAENCHAVVVRKLILSIGN